ncbi:hypothetical protein [Parasitella parasitica]|uniref:Uncharacterized protein n=1 Tax=Parasitella parasitica TaxID=35722 RepID=A0A0B7N497_9FUNG|nr:hypothetical protein [Parasitella parasitica]
MNANQASQICEINPGDWSAPHSKNQEPTANKRLIKMLTKNGVSVYLISEYKTTSYCPACESELEQTCPKSSPLSKKQAANRITPWSAEVQKLFMS